jgi:hypothetical protein
VGLEVSGRRSNRAELVVQAEHPHLVAHFAQGLDDVVLHLPLGFEYVNVGRILGWDEMVVYERKDPKLLHQRKTRCPPLCR